MAQSQGQPAASRTCAPNGTTESLPLPRRTAPPIAGAALRPCASKGQLPISGWDADVDIAQGANGRIDRLVVRDASLSKVLALLAQTYHLNIVAANDIDAVISITLRDVRARGSAHRDPLGGQLHLGQPRRHHPDHVADRHGQLAAGRAGPRSCRSSISTLRRPTVVSEAVDEFPLADRQDDRSSRAIRPTIAAPAR